MKLYTSMGPNPRVVRMFLAEKGLEVEMETVDLIGGENRRPPYVTLNPAAQTPALVTDTGQVLTEITAICEYLEELEPARPLIGQTPLERAETRMWTRRIDLRVCEPMTSGFRFAEGLAIFEGRTRCLPEAAPGLKAIAQDGLAWVEANFAGPWIAGDRYTLADILLFAFLDFGAGFNQPLPASLQRLSTWFELVKSRPAAAQA